MAQQHSMRKRKRIDGLSMIPSRLLLPEIIVEIGLKILGGPSSISLNLGGQTLYTFGYDLSSDDYKVAVIYGNKAKMYSLKFGRWKDINDVPHIPNSWCHGTFSNKAFHWMVRDTPMSYHHYRLSNIVSLDLANETYSEVSPPPLYGDKCDGVNRSFTEIHEFDGVFEACTHIDSLVSPISPLDSEQIEESSSYFMWENGSECEKEVDRIKKQFDDCMAFFLRDLVCNLVRVPMTIIRRWTYCYWCVREQVYHAWKLLGCNLRFGDLSRQATIGGVNLGIAGSNGLSGLLLRNSRVGVSSFFRSQSSSSFQVVWRYLSHDNCLKVPIYQLYNGLNGHVFFSAAFNSTWSSIITEVNSLKVKGVDLISHCKICVGKGTGTSFWKDLWIGDNLLKAFFSSIVALEEIKT
ncbi:hypothetical protein Tco_0902406 [Tanacetum coccineum]